MTWTPDGGTLYFSSSRGGGALAIWRMGADGSAPAQVTSASGFTSDGDPRLSPAAGVLAFTRNNALWVRDLGTGTESFLVGSANVSVTAIDWVH